VTDVPVSECQALVAFYDATGGPGWTTSTGWLSTTRIGSWFGVTTQNGHVTFLSLEHDNLTGTLPSALSGLPYLWDFDVYGNQLTGAIPTELGSLTDLNWLGLGFNNFTGTLPSELGNLTQLTILDVDGNKLSGTIPSWLVDLTSLQDLYLHLNQFSGSIPSWLGQMTSLQYLALGSNQLTGSIPPELGNLTNLQLLWLNNLQLSGPVPSQLANLNKLTYLDLQDDGLTGTFPSWLGALTSLQTLYLDSNQLSGSIPSWLGSLTNLQTLSLTYNQFSGSIPVELGNLTGLQQLWLSSNQLSGPVPPELGQMVSLTKLALGNNQLTGTIPSELGSLTALQTLDLSGNQLTGAIPSELGSLANLQYLYLMRNELAGPMPLSLDKLTNLVGLYFDSTVCEPADPTFEAWFDQLAGASAVSLCTSGTVTPPTAAPTATPPAPPTAAPTPTPTSTPAIPLSLTVDSGFNQMLLEWSPSADPDTSAYQIYRATSSAPATFVPIAVVGDDQYFDTAALTPQENYCYQVVALVNGNMSEGSNSACGVYGQVNLWVPTTYAVSGTTVIVPVNIRNATGLDLASADVWLAYDPAVLQGLDVSQTALSAGFAWAKSIDNTNGLVKISAAIGEPEPIYGDGSLFWLTFHVIGDSGASSALHLTPFAADVGGTSMQTVNADDFPVDVPLSLTDGKLLIQNAGKLGDVDGNGVVAAADAYLALQMAVGKIQPTAAQKYAADVNGDGVVSAADVTMILYYAVNGAWPLPPANSGRRRAGVRSGGPTTVLSLDDVSGTAGAVVTTTLRAKGLSQWSGGDWTIAYDRSLITRIVGVAPAGLARNATLAYRDDGQGRLWISAAQSAPVSGDGPLAVVTLQLAAHPGAASGTLSLASAALSDPYGRDYVLSAMQGTIERQNATVSAGNTIYLPVMVHS
jgi:Leucine-rich repeat (LRR) protein